MAVVERKRRLALSAGEARLPHTHVHDEGQHEDVREGEPDAA